MPQSQIAAAQTPRASAPPLNALYLPAPKSTLLQSGGTRPVQAGEAPDIVVLTETNAALLIPERLVPARSALLPVVDASPTASHPRGINAARSDVSVPPNQTGMRDGLAMTLPMIERIRLLPAELLNCRAPDRLLLARLFVRDRGMAPARDPNVRATVRYPDEDVIPQAAQIAQTLADVGYMERRLVDCVSVCPNCGSGRLCAREVCGRCRSPDLQELSIIHHFRCAYQATEDEFAAEPNPVCPNCRRPLEYFSVDHDRPGSVVRCRGCQFTSGESLAAFLCLDCGSDTPSDQVGSLRINAYTPTPAGIRWATNETAAADLCGARSVADRLRNFAEAIAADGGRDHCVLSVLLSPAHGQHMRDRLHQKSCALLATLLREAFKPDVTILDDAPIFFVLLPNEAKSEWEAALIGLRRQLEQHMRLADALRYRLYGGDELAAMAAAYARIRRVAWTDHAC